jgi:hypothetical protein
VHSKGPGHTGVDTLLSHFSTNFHSRIKPITPRPTPSNPSTSASLIRIRASRSNDLLSTLKN